MKENIAPYETASLADQSVKKSILILYVNITWCAVAIFGKSWMVFMSLIRFWPAGFLPSSWAVNSLLPFRPPVSGIEHSATSTCHYRRRF